MLHGSQEIPDWNRRTQKNGRTQEKKMEENWKAIYESFLKKVEKSGKIWK